ncbi:MAG: SdpI family protein [Pseudomonadota bacterium]
MKKFFYISMAITMATVLLGFYLQTLGVSADRDGAGLADEMRALGFAPILWPLLFPLGGLVLTGLNLMMKRCAVAKLWNSESVGKAGAFTAVSILVGPVMALMLQTFVGLKSYDLIDKTGMLTGVALFQAALFLFFGNYVATARRTIGGGFNTPWTKRDDLIWRKTQRFLGRGIIVVTLFALASLYFAPPKPLIFAHIVAIVTMKIIAAGYSYALWRQSNDAQSFQQR